MSNQELIRKYDTKGNLICSKYSDGYEYWREYDSNGNCIHYKNSNGYEVWREYDSNGNMIHFKNSNGYEYWKEYDANDKYIHFKDSNGYEKWYDPKGKLIDKPQASGYNSTMNNGTTHYIIENSKLSKWLRTPIGICDGYSLTPSPLEATQFDDLDHAKRHIRIYSEMHSINEMDFKIIEVTVHRTYKEVITKEMALKCLETLAWGGAYSDEKQINARTMLKTFIEQKD